MPRAVWLLTAPLLILMAEAIWSSQVGIVAEHDRLAARGRRSRARSARRRMPPYAGRLRPGTRCQARRR